MSKLRVDEWKDRKGIYPHYSPYHNNAAGQMDEYLLVCTVNPTQCAKDNLKNKTP